MTKKINALSWCFVFVLLVVMPTLGYRGNELNINPVFSSTVWKYGYILSLPFCIYFFFILIPSKIRNKFSDFPFAKSDKTIRIPIYTFLVLFSAGLAPALVHLETSVLMDIFNKSEFHVSAKLYSLNKYKPWRSLCRTDAKFITSQGEQKDLCVDKKFGLPQINISTQLNNGNEYILIGRQSMMGRVVDRIASPSY
jgi:hypothetical protein